MSESEYPEDQREARQWPPAPPTTPSNAPNPPTAPSAPTPWWSQGPHAWPSEPPTAPQSAPTATPNDAPLVEPTSTVPPAVEAPAASAWPPQAPAAWPPPPPSSPPGGGWGPPPPAPPGSGPGAPWGAYGPPPASASAGKRITAAIAAVVLVVASAVTGALVAVAVHHDKSSASVTFPGFGPSVNNPGNGSGSSSSAGTLDAQAIADKVIPAIVNINTTLSRGRAAGTGMVISADGLVLTNNHVIADATSIKVDIGGTGNTHNAHVIGYDLADDVALVQIEGVSNLKTVTFGDPSNVNVGDPVVAIGNALGQGGTPKVTQGKVTALNQTVTAGDPSVGTSETLHGVIQIDAPIQPGDSGGALVDANGNVIGMNTAAAGGRFRQQLGSNIGFAIPVDNAISVVHQIQSGVETGRVHIGPRGLLGVSVRNAADAAGTLCADQTAVSTGAVVLEVQAGASDIGIGKCDVIVSVAGKDIADTNALNLALSTYHPGDRVAIGWVDTNGQRHDATAELTPGPPA